MSSWSHCSETDCFSSGVRISIIKRNYRAGWFNSIWPWMAQCLRVLNFCLPNCNCGWSSSKHGGQTLNPFGLLFSICSFKSCVWILLSTAVTQSNRFLPVAYLAITLLSSAAVHHLLWLATIHHLFSWLLLCLLLGNRNSGLLLLSFRRLLSGLLAGPPFFILPCPSAASFIKRNHLSVFVSFYHTFFHLYFRAFKSPYRAGTILKSERSRSSVAAILKSSSYNCLRSCIRSATFGFFSASWYANPDTIAGRNLVGASYCVIEPLTESSMRRMR